jgi:hypothetical protein
VDYSSGGEQRAFLTHGKKRGEYGSIVVQILLRLALFAIIRKRRFCYSNKGSTLETAIAEAPKLNG